MVKAKKLPLEGIRVLEFAHAVMGPACGMILGDMGAEVIHIEAPAGDPTRRLRGFGTGYFPYFGRNKKSLAVNLKSERGLQLIRQMIEKVDVVVENFGPGTMERLGLGYQVLRELQPGLIYCSLKGFLSGPYESRHAMDEVVQMMGGLAYMTGPKGSPLRAGTSVVDITGGMFGVIAILAALRQKEQTGEGTCVKSALFETTAFLMGQHMAYGRISGEPVPPMPERVSAWSVYRIFQTLDGEGVFVGIISDKHWVRFCEAFGLDALAQDTRLMTNNGRIEERDWLLPFLEKFFLGLAKSEVMQRCEQADIPFAPVARPEDLFEDPHLNQSGALVDTEIRPGLSIPLPKLPLEWSELEFSVRHPPPEIGEHTAEVLAEFLGLGAEEITELAEASVVVQASNSSSGRVFLRD